ncbi:uncharacterized protein J8A68_001622 [[Candida] subhashii]|uniref:F-box domain-containing protein n=1 Tax=[Candida] subhashii TaxID=561895 RepID=A0A8J5V401_9ASCO|nr:uncharacterized protein J8A68_001622 [[Candida] subhashii]KAG7664864.1 hypothetical protein J8A68_001622 [[Candida] subhashii]
MLQKLPVEILDLIVENIHHQDVLHLSQTNKTLYRWLHPKLYHGNVMDRAPTRYSIMEQTDNLNEIIKMNNDRLQPEGGSRIPLGSISSIYGLKLFFKNLVENPEYCKYIKGLIFNGNSPDVPDLEIYGYLRQCIPLMSELRVFHWYKQGMKLPGDLFSENHRLEELRGYFDFSCNKHSQNLLSLELCDVNDLTDLKNISMDSLKKLSIGSKQKSINLSTMLQATSKQMKLKELALKNIDLCHDDVTRLSPITDWNMLQSLTIDDCSDSRFDMNTHSISKSFLSGLKPYVQSLKQLNLALNDFQDSHHLFSFLQDMTLSKLNIEVDHNVNHNISFFTSTLLSCLNPDALTHLEFKVRFGRSSSSSKDKMFDIYSLNKLREFTKLQFLQLPIIESDITNLLAFIPKNVECISFSCKEDESEQQFSSISSLIHPEYWQLATINVISRDEKENFPEIINKYQQKLPKLKWVNFNKNNNEYTYEINNKSSIYRESLSFKTIIRTLHP